MGLLALKNLRIAQSPAPHPENRDDRARSAPRAKINLKDGPIVVLDEPMSAMDAHTERRFPALTRT
jgi:ABC-type thiamine transport system ATPase subunit